MTVVLLNKLVPSCHSLSQPTLLAAALLALTSPGATVNAVATINTTVEASMVSNNAVVTDNSSKDNYSVANIVVATNNLCCDQC